LIVETRFEVGVEGILLRGSWFAAEGASAGTSALPVLAILHGIPRAKPAPGDQSYRDLARGMAEDGFLSLIFNFRGTGESEGNLGLAGWNRDLAAVLAFARALPAADPSRLALLGFSAGGAVAIRAAADDPAVSAVAAVGSPAEYTFLQALMPAAGWVSLFREIGLIRDPAFPPSLAEWEAEFERAAPLPCVGRISPRPLLLIHGEDDETIPREHARMLYERAGEPRELLLLPGGKHRLRVDPRALAAARDWLLRWRDGGKG
jgi:putative redox protein